MSSSGSSDNAAPPNPFSPCRPGSKSHSVISRKRTRLSRVSSIEIASLNLSSNDTRQGTGILRTLALPPIGTHGVVKFNPSPPDNLSSSSVNSTFGDRLSSWWDTFVSKYVPPWKAYTWGIQMCCTLLISLLPMFVDDWNAKYFYNDAHWISISATAVTDFTAGGSLLKILDRIVGTVIGASILMISYALLTSFLAQPYNMKTIQWVTYGVTLMVGILAGWIKAIFPTRVVMPSYIVVTGFVLAGVSAKTDTNLLVAAGYRILSVIIGTFISGIVTNTVFPQRVRGNLRNGMKSLLETMGMALHHLVYLEVGVVEPGSMVLQTGSIPATPLNRESTSVDQFPGSSLIISHSNMDEVTARKQWEKLTAVRKGIWKDVAASWKLLFAQETSVGSAKHEISLRHHPHKFPTKANERVFSCLRVIFFQIVSLLTSLDEESDEIELLREGSKWIIEDPKAHMELVRRGVPPIPDTFGDSWEDASLLRDEEYSDEVLMRCEEELLECDCHPIVNLTLEVIPYILEVAACASTSLSDLSKLVFATSKDIFEEAERKMEMLTNAVAELHKYIQTKQKNRIAFVDSVASSSVEETVRTHFKPWTGVDTNVYNGWDRLTRKFYWNCYWYTMQKVSYTEYTLQTLEGSIRCCYDAFVQLAIVEKRLPTT